MKYFVVNIQKLSDSTAQSIFAYDTREKALSSYHSTLASNYASDSLKGFAVCLIDEHGSNEMSEYFDVQPSKEG